MTFWRFWSLSERLGEFFFGFFDFSLSLSLVSLRLVVCLSGLLVEDKKEEHPTHNTRNDEKGERWMVMQTHLQKGVDADNFNVFFFSSRLR